MREAIKHYDFKVLEGARSKALQNQYFHAEKSKLKWPHGKHNIISPEEAASLGVAPREKAEAVDVVPYPVDWRKSRKNRFFYLAGVIMLTAELLKVPLRWGHDWDRDQDFYDQTFNDYPHFELDFKTQGRLSVPA